MNAKMIRRPGRNGYAVCLLALLATWCNKPDLLRERQPRRVTALAAAGNSTCALLENGKVACVGRTGTLENLPGIYPTSVTARETQELPLNFAAKQLAVASNQRSMHACALSDAGRIYCWGRNTEGQLGPATETKLLEEIAGKAGISAKMLADFVPVRHAAEIPLKGRSLQVVTGYAHTCALSEWGFVQCWGGNHFGQLGQDRRKLAGRVGQSLEPLFVSVLSSAETKSGLRVVTLAAGEKHTCALLSGGNVRCWGDNYFGQLGHVARPVENRGPDEAMLVPEPPDVRGNVPVLSEQEKAQGLKVNTIAAAGHRSCAVLSNGKVRCWGQNRFVGLGYPQHTFDKVSQLRAPHELGDINLGEPARRIAMGRHHACIISQRGSVFCWGSGDQGQLGQPSIVSTEKPENMPPRAVPLLSENNADSISELALGDSHTCVLVTGGTMRCWGQAFDGQLGTGAGKTYGKVKCRNFSATCIGDEGEELPPAEISW